MRQVPGWDEYFIGEAAHAATRSKDPNTQVGAAIVNTDNRVIAKGYNGMPDGFPETAETWGDAQKDDHVVHAEVNAIANAARTGVATLGARIYVTLPPCLPCARVIAAAGIAEVVMSREAYRARIDQKPIWEERFAQAFEHLGKAGVRKRMI